MSDGIPVVSLAGWKNGEAQNDQARVQLLGDAITKFGFVALVDHGVPVEELAAFYELSQQVFDLPGNVLETYERPDTGRQTGYTPRFGETSVGADKPNDMRFWQIRRPGNVIENVWPTEVDAFEERGLWLFEYLDAVSHPVFDMLSQYAGLEPGYFPHMIEGGDSLLRVIDYPALDEDQVGRTVRSGKHEDICLGTLLVTSTVAGLEIFTRRTGWMPVNNPPGSIIFNTGDMAMLHTSWHPDFPDHVQFPSTTHRVVAMRARRNSAPFFVHPRGDVELVPGYTAAMALKKRLQQIGLLART